MSKNVFEVHGQAIFALWLKLPTSNCRVQFSIGLHYYLDISTDFQSSFFDTKLRDLAHY